MKKTDDLSFNERIIAVQKELKAPKSQFNSFGKYKYRSQEDILEALKPLLAKYELLQAITDDIVAVGNRVYVQATVTVSDASLNRLDEGYASISVSGFAREPENKKGMDESQITGTASSYARKYALNGMWLIDDTKDADTDEHTVQTKRNKPTLKPDTEKWVKAIHSLASGAVTLSFVKDNYDISKENLKRLEAEFKQVAHDQIGGEA